MFQSNKNVFWEALLVAIFIFAIGLIMGVVFENSRTQNIQNLYSDSDIQLLNLKIQSQLFSLPGFNCSQAIAENIKFGDQIFSEALLLQKYEDSQTITDSLRQEHRKYDLLRTMFWLNSIDIKQKCGNSFHTVVYLYKYDSDLNTQAQQTTFSRALSDLKDKYGDEIVLIPIAGNMDLSSTQSLMDYLGITQLPVVIIDEKTKITAIQDMKDIEKYL